MMMMMKMMKLGGGVHMFRNSWLHSLVLVTAFQGQRRRCFLISIHIFARSSSSIRSVSSSAQSVRSFQCPRELFLFYSFPLVVVVLVLVFVIVALMLLSNVRCRRVVP